MKEEKKSDSFVLFIKAIVSEQEYQKVTVMKTLWQCDLIYASSPTLEGNKKTNKEMNNTQESCMVLKKNQSIIIFPYPIYIFI